MRTSELIKDVKVTTIVGQCDSEVVKLTYDSRCVESGSCFFAIRGLHFDGHDFIGDVVRGGASVVVCESLEGLDLLEGAECCFIVVESSEEAMGHMARNFYGDPSRELRLIGITGTNGKTTTATLLCDLFEELGFHSGLISTVCYRIGNETIDSTHTTPDSIRLSEMMRRMVDAGCDYCFMEVSSHSVVQRRIEGLHFAGAVFTNLTQDHLDYHGSFMEYLKAKKRLFDLLPKGAFAIVNGDDRNGSVMVQNCAARVSKYSLRSMAELRGRVIEMHFDGMLLSLDGVELWVRLLGKFNAYNLLSIYGVARELGVGRDEALVAMSRLGGVRGRFEHFEAPEGRTIIIDYAHTPDAVASTLSTIAEIGGSAGIVTICGCGGDRDREKRPIMARIAYEGSTTTIFTSDNPRSEDPEAILEEMVEGVREMAREQGRRYIKISDRREAIRTGVMLSKPGDVILIAGKGHETYQVVGAQRLHFDDKEEARRAVELYLG
ncbi:MAG: UDP-N-acetylmuramoyl-L-alanyl-D-glutamate--2,6-diaminopimelate ligase [Rikenellaceae bacterium]